MKSLIYLYMACLVFGYFNITVMIGKRGKKIFKRKVKLNISTWISFLIALLMVVALDYRDILNLRDINIMTIPWIVTLISVRTIVVFTIFKMLTWFGEDSKKKMILRRETEQGHIVSLTRAMTRRPNLLGYIMDLFYQACCQLFEKSRS